MAFLLVFRARIVIHSHSTLCDVCYIHTCDFFLWLRSVHTVRLLLRFFSFFAATSLKCSHGEAAAALLCHMLQEKKRNRGLTVWTDPYCSKNVESKGIRKLASEPFLWFPWNHQWNHILLRQWEQYRIRRKLSQVWTDLYTCVVSVDVFLFHHLSTRNAHFRITISLLLF